MRTYEEIWNDAREGVPFSNMTSFEVWTANACARGSGCVHDGTWGSGPDGADCPLLTVAMAQRTPKEWTEHTPQEQAQLQAYECDAYEEFVATATDDEPDEDPDAGYEPDGWRPVVILPTQEGLF